MKTKENPKPLSMVILTAIVIALAAVSYYYLYQDEIAPRLEETDITEETIVSNQEIIEVRAIETLGLLQGENFDSLSEYVHPAKGVRFSPYTFVDVENDVILIQDDVKNILADSRSFNWGNYDGSGEPMNKPFKEYFDEFVYDQDFFSAPEVSYDDPIGTGNMINNASEVYSDAIIVEYYFDGFDPEYEGMDWVSLKLVFEKYEKEWYLVGIIHNSWTI
jgi:hypothetical protein